MRQNLPVSQQEYPLPPGATLMSTTDPASHVDYANAAFIEACGFGRDELMGQPHNLVRHPDMPPAAYEDLWRTLRGGDSWTALVKNRRKDGDFYWVRANVTPVRRQGRLTGYMSVRTTPSRKEVARAEALYRRMAPAHAGGVARPRVGLFKGVVVRRGLLAWTTLHKWLPVRWRIRAAFAACALAAAAAQIAAGPPMQGPALAATLALTGGMAWWLERGLAQPLQLILAQASAVAAGQLDAHVHLDRVDEIGLVLRAVNQAGLNLAALVDDVGLQVHGMESATSEIAAGNLDLSARTEQAAASLQQTAASMEQLSATVARNAQAAHQAAGRAAAANGVAAHGGQLMSQVVATMGEIGASSQRIGDIVGVIDGIAAQTGILALNAAVEAARAGEQGKGFAVVAAEVRALAQRSAAAAGEIKLLVDSGVGRIGTGAQLVGDAGATMANLVGEMEQVCALVHDISSASAEQTAGIAQIGAAMGELDRMTQQNAALVEQAAAASASLKSQASRLLEAVRVYRG